MQKILIKASKEEFGLATGLVYREAVRTCLESNFSDRGLSILRGVEPNWEELSWGDIKPAELEEKCIDGDLSEALYWKGT